jgi:predicted unusual protein kinase regulating ubiquinone biosynthesis (AarF/ABC1/UbiB family)
VTFWPLAAMASSATSAVPSIRPWFGQHAKVIRRSLLFLLAAKLWWDRRQVKKRQAMDATSEWGRYASNPGARGRALGALIALQIVPLFWVSKIARKRWRERLLDYSGDILADGLLQVGPLYIKMGQIMSSRDDIVPPQWVKALERLQDEVPARKGDQAFELAYEAWPGGKVDFDSTFVDFDPTPIAAASLGQVHKAVLRSNNDTVAIKLQRPFLRQIYDQDFVLLTKIAAAVDRFAGSAGQVGGIQQSWSEIFVDAEAILYREIDYRDEASNGVRFCQDFGLATGGAGVTSTALSLDKKTLPSAAGWIRAPFVYDSLSSEKVLVMEFVPSIKVTKLEKLNKAGVTLKDREYLADCLGRAYLRQFCCNLFFSTDPHPGNLGVEVLDSEATVPGKRVRLVFYDFGQAAELDRQQADGILDVIEAIVDLDVDKSVASFQKMKVLKESADLELVRAKVRNNFETGKIKSNRKRLSKRGYKFAPPAEKDSSIAKTSREPPKDSEVMQYFTLPAEYAFVGRAMSQMDGVGKVLDPEFDFVSAAAPWIYEIKGTGQYLQEEASKWLQSLCSKIRQGLGMNAQAS